MKSQMPALRTAIEQPKCVMNWNVHAPHIAAGSGQLIKGQLLDRGSAKMNDQRYSG
jgi:hypothetical protein